MNVLLVSTPKENVISTTIPENINKRRGVLPPLGLLYIGTYLRKYSTHRVSLVDCEAENISYREFAEKVRGIKPEVVGIQVMTFSLIDALKTAETVKDVSKETIVVFGGPHVTIYPEETLAHKNVDYIVRQEGEYSFKLLLDNLNNSEGLNKIKGIGYKLQNRPVITEEPELIEDLGALPFPDRRLIPIEKYRSILSDNFPVTTSMTSRGCPFNCIYCERMGKRFRAVPAGKVVEEIEDCLSLGIKEVFFHDDTFTVDKERVRSICGLIMDKKLKFSWDVRSRVDTVDYDLLKLMYRAGCRRISFGVESSSPLVLKNLRKNITLQQISEVFSWCRKIGLITLADFMLGSPGEKLSDVKNSINFAKKLKADYVQFSITTPYPQTDLYKEALNRGLIKRDVWREFALNPHPDFTAPVWGEYFSKAELNKLAAYAYRKYYLTWGFIFAELSRIRSLKGLQDKIKAGFGLFKKSEV